MFHRCSYTSPYNRQ